MLEPDECVHVHAQPGHREMGVCVGSASCSPPYVEKSCLDSCRVASSSHSRCPGDHGKSHTYALACETRWLSVSNAASGVREGVSI